MIKYFVLILAYIFLILTIYVDGSKIKRKIDNQIRRIHCFAVSFGIMTILLFLMELTRDKTIVFLFGKNYLLIGLCVFSIILKKYSKTCQK